MFLLGRVKALGCAAVAAAMVWTAMAGPAEAKRTGNGGDGEADLVCVSKTADPTTLTDGVPSTIAYTVTIKNQGDATANNVTVTDDLPDGATVVVTAALTAACGALNVDPIICSLGDLAPGQTGVLSFSVDVPDPMEGVPIINSAFASADGPISSNTCAVTVTVTPPGDEACTPGFWRNHHDLWPAGLLPNDSFEAEFGVSLPFGNVNSEDKTLDEAVHLGGGNCKKLLRHGTAAYFNALFGGFSLTDADVIQKIQDAFAGGGDCQPQANEFGVLNENKICLAAE